MCTPRCGGRSAAAGLQCGAVVWALGQSVVFCVVRLVLLACAGFAANTPAHRPGQAPAVRLRADARVGESDWVKGCMRRARRVHKVRYWISGGVYMWTVETGCIARARGQSAWSSCIRRGPSCTGMCGTGEISPGVEGGCCGPEWLDHNC